jgi:hypothetical protein
MNDLDRRIQFKVGAEIRGCESEVMKAIRWPWPWPFEVRADGQIVAVCRDYEAAMGAADDWEAST